MGASLERGSLLHKRYRIVEILGQGGMGSVYCAVDENLGVDVAVKENLFTTDEYARQFRLEAVILANLRHSNLPRVTDHFVIAEQGQYLIMDYIEGEDLRQRMERTGNISEEEAILVGTAMCDALQYLHTRKPAIIHRDMKPGNVRITPDGHIFLVDFGLAKLVKGSQATTTGARAMTPGYSPPEQYGTARTDPRTDIYSLGATLYAALTGVIPEDGLARAMDNVELVPLRKRNPKVSRKLASAIEKAMAVRPDDRFQSADEFKQALLSSNVKTQQLGGEIFLAGPANDPINSDLVGSLVPEAPATALKDPDPPAPPHPKPRKEARGARWWIFFSVFLLALLLLALVSIIVFWTPITKAFIFTSTSTLGSPLAQVINTSLPSLQPQVDTTTPQAFSTVTQTPIPVYLPTNTPAPTGTQGPVPTQIGGGTAQIAFASDRTGAPQIYIMNTTDSNLLQQVTNMANGACQPSWSPDGSRLAFISPCLKRQDQYPDANIFTINADGSGLAEWMPDKVGDFDPAWSPDGSKIAFTSVRDGSPEIYVLTLSDNSVKALTSSSSDVLFPDWSFQPAWSPSGTQIIYSGHSRLTDALQIWVMSDAGLGPKQLIHQGDLKWDVQPNWSPDGKTILFSETNGDQELGYLMRFDAQNHAVYAARLRAGSYGTKGEYSPDGSLVVFESTDMDDVNRSDYDLYLVMADGTGAITRLTNVKSMEFDPTWRPAGNP